MKTIRKKISALLVRFGLYGFTRRHVLRVFGDLRHDGDVHFFSRIIQPHDLVFDIGANRGQSVEIFTELGASVVAFEPLSHLHPYILQSKHPNGGLTVSGCGLGSEIATLAFHPANYDQVSSFRSDWTKSDKPTIMVKVSTLEDEIIKYGIPNYCKIDVEGWELEVISGMKSSIPIISFEYHLRELDVIPGILSALASISAYEYRIRPAGNAGFISKDLLSGDEVMDALRRMSDSKESSRLFGDIFCFRT